MREDSLVKPAKMPLRLKLVCLSTGGARTEIFIAGKSWTDNRPGAEGLIRGESGPLLKWKE